VLAVMDHAQIERAALVGWSHGACTALILARAAQQRLSGVFIFACSMDPTRSRDFVVTPVIDRCFRRHVADYTDLSSTAASSRIRRGRHADAAHAAQLLGG
jgi:pimeloyl-ACP methyl ester carboxylesterase